ncbi:hypothetical protein BDN70DRAFT_930821 [Pholiota conissans]|uniref:Uncharacterized protein n=1 Tax=Pholiota conissans TaxID=109636 RepID=A0A9P5Z4N4_9AGAR|nr:hypothetical protein BDN70DRAFT_930821 [Pholiota conissans]
MSVGSPTVMTMSRTRAEMTGCSMGIKETLSVRGGGVHYTLSFSTTIKPISFKYNSTKSQPQSRLRYAIGRGLNAIVSAIASVIMAIIGAITMVIVSIFNFIGDILCCRCFGSRRRTGRTRRSGRGRMGRGTY